MRSTLRRNADRVIPLALLGLAAIFLAAFYIDYTRRIDIGDREVVGYITYKYNRVERRLEDHVVWSSLYSNSPLANRDTIRSESYAEAKIHLADGTVINLDENSMIYLDISEETARIDFRSGTIQINQGSGASAVEVVSGDRTIRAEDSDFTVGARGNDLSVTVGRGQASVNSAGGGAAVVGRDQRAEIGEGGAVDVRDLSIRLSAPDNLSVMPVEGGQSSVRFTWSFLRPVREARLEISRFSNFSRVERSAPAGGSSATMSLSAGSWYWRVRGRAANGAAEISETRKIALVASERVLLFSPANGEEISFVREAPLVQFGWSEHAFAREYILEVSRNPRFTGEVRRERARNNSAGLDGLAPGRYFWRVRTEPSVDTIQPSVSPALSFSIVKLDDYPRPQIMQPRDGGQVSTEDLSGDGALLSWNAPREIRNYRVRVGRDPNFRDSVVDREVTGNFITLKEEVAREGRYYWRVEGRTPDGATASQTGSFFVVNRASAWSGGDEDAGGAADPVAEKEKQEERAAARTDEALRRLKPDDIEFLSPETIYK